MPGEDLVQHSCTRKLATIVLATVNWFPIWHRFEITFSHQIFLTWLGTPQEYIVMEESSLQFNISKVQIKNIKLHIVTDIKVNFNSMLGFRISNLVGGKGTLTKQLKIFSIFSLHFRSRVTVSHTMLQDIQPCKRPQPALVQDQKAYGTRCSQAVPHPSTILARRCLTSVIRRERVCSSWYGRRRWTYEIARCNDTLWTLGNMAVPGHATSQARTAPGLLAWPASKGTDKKYQTTYSHWY